MENLKSYSSPDIVRTRKVDVLNANGPMGITFGEGDLMQGKTPTETYERTKKREEADKKGKQLGKGMFILGAILTYYIVYKIVKS